MSRLRGRRVPTPRVEADLHLISEDLNADARSVDGHAQVQCPVGGFFAHASPRVSLGLLAELESTVFYAINGANVLFTINVHFGLEPKARRR